MDKDYILELMISIWPEKTCEMIRSLQEENYKLKTELESKCKTIDFLRDKMFNHDPYGVIFDHY